MRGLDGEQSLARPAPQFLGGGACDTHSRAAGAHQMPASVLGVLCPGSPDHPPHSRRAVLLPLS